MSRSVVLADGASAPGHLKDRHFIKIGGEPLLKRTVRQFAAFSDVVVIASDRRYAEELADEPCEVVPGDGKEVYYGADMIRKGLDHREGIVSWLVFGDVYFTDKAIYTIKAGIPYKQGWAMYGRSTNNPYTGTPWAEPFVIELGHVSNARCRAALDTILGHFLNRHWRRCSPWEWYYEMEGMPYEIPDVKHVPTGPHWVEINDLTDDIDFREDAANLEDAVRRQYDSA